MIKVQHLKDTVILRRLVIDGNNIENNGGQFPVPEGEVAAHVLSVGTEMNESYGNLSAHSFISIKCVMS